jgi:hypothetical protein
VQCSAGGAVQCRGGGGGAEGVLAGCVIRHSGIVWLKSQVERSRSVPVLLLFGYKITRTE